MLDQSFSSRTFQEIFDIENRKGINVEKRFRQDFEKSLQKVTELKNINKEIQKERESNKRKLLIERKREIKNEREKIIVSILERISKKINNYKINIDLAGKFGGQSYKFEENVTNFFISKKLQENIRETYFVKQSSRHAILNQFVSLIEDNFPKLVIRTDIKNFYESIPQKNLLEKIDSDYLLSIMSKKFIKNVFVEYNRLSGQLTKKDPKGVPRGVGISAYLSELFMRSIDNKIKEMDDLVFYGRYVDDIVAVFIPQKKNISHLFKYRKKIKEIVEDEGIKLNTSKTKEYDLLNNINSIAIEKHDYLDGELMSKQIYNDEINNPKSIHFLGYRIGSVINKIQISNPSPGQKAIKQNLSICVELSENKYEKYLNKIKKSFKDFKDKNGHNRKYAFELLKARINYLTSNTKLRNNKDKVYVGIYYSNPFLNNYTSLEKLQAYLKWNIGHSNLTLKEKKALNYYSFINGFDKKTFQVLPIKKKKYYRKNLKQGDTNNEKNKGILQFGLTEINSIWKR